MADPAPILIHTRCPALVPEEQVTVTVDVISTAAPARTLTLPKAIVGMLTVHVCASALVEMVSSKIAVRIEANIHR